MAGDATTCVVAAFEDEYRRIYGLTIPDVAVEVVTWRLSAYAGPRPSSRGLAATGAGAPSPHAAPCASPNAADVDTPV